MAHIWTKTVEDEIYKTGIIKDYLGLATKMYHSFIKTRSP